jgi:3-oxoacyl-[acyl-carrier protein] reductase
MSEKRTALVTGAGRGIGRAIALELAANGCDVAVNYAHSADAALDAVKQIEALGVKAAAVKADVTKKDEVTAMFREVSEKLAPVQILVCNAGITRDNLLMRMKDEEWNEVIAADLSSLFYCAKEAIRPMIKAHWGRIIAISSVTGLIGNPGQCNYSAAKAGVTGFVKSLAREIASRNITVNAVAPGFIATDMTSSLSDDVKETIAKNIPAGRMGSAKDVAQAVAFLASDAASYIEGQVIAVDGGMTMC